MQTYVLCCSWCYFYTITKPYLNSSGGNCRFLFQSIYPKRQEISIVINFCQSIKKFLCEFDCYRLLISIDSNWRLISIESIYFRYRFLQAPDFYGSTTPGSEKITNSKSKRNQRSRTETLFKTGSDPVYMIRTEPSKIICPEIPSPPPFPTLLHPHPTSPRRLNS